MARGCPHAANAALDPGSLATSSLPAVVALQGAWIDLDNLFTRDSEDEPGTQIRGELELRQILGDQVSGVDALHLARPKPQQAPRSTRCWTLRYGHARLVRP